MRFAFFIIMPRVFRRLLAAIGKGLRVIAIGSLVFLGTLSAFAQRYDAGYATAARDWEGFSPDQRIKLQVLLTAAGFWDSVPNLEFSSRLYEAVRAFQIANGLSGTGFIGKPEIDRLLTLGEPILSSGDSVSSSTPSAATRYGYLWHSG